VGAGHAGNLVLREVEQNNTFPGKVVGFIDDDVRKLDRSINGIPVIGIGAGPHTDGQILVLQDMLGITLGHTAKFVKNFMADASTIQEALSNYHQEVKANTFPAEEHCFQ
ncbi:MAG: 3-methyl-2-oxobutanoate hydroxymethyltransferase, partial [Oceanospirillum sp.]|nr:3-methyl-2-oxobutanoate hydroxymethyltransferase [Oceanospirillum sp.]